MLPAALAFAPASASAAPVVTVRARTRVDIERVVRSPSGITVRGRLVEIGTDAPIPGLSLYVGIEGEGMDRMVTTTRDGRFAVSFPLDQGTYQVSARFLGNDEHSASEVRGLRFDVGKDTPSLAIAAPPDVEAGRDLEGALLADVGGEPVRLRVHLSLADAAGDFREVLRVDTDETGRAALRIPAADLAGAGDRRLRAEFKGDDAFNPVALEVPLRIMSTTRIVDLVTSTGTVPYEGAIVLAGRLVDEAGAGVAGVTVNLVGGGERVGGARTDDTGRFSGKLRASRFAAGDLTLAVEYVSTTPWRRGARTPPVTLTIAEPRPVPIGYLIGAFALTCAFVTGFAVARTRPWEPLYARWRKWRASRRPGAADAPTAAAPGATDTTPATGLKPGRPTLMSTLRRPADHIVSGVVRDVLTGQALAGARVVLELAGQPTLELVTDPAGRFEVGPLVAGTWKAWAQAKGYVTESFTATCPHRGELRDVRIDLLPVREKVFTIYRAVAVTLLPKPELWGVWTPREILDHVKARRPTGALRALTDFVEEAYFSPRTPEENVLPECTRRAQLARQELGATRDM